MTGCEICGRSPPNDNVSLLRLNVKGVTGRWTCNEHAKVFGAYNRRLAGEANPANRPMSDAEIDDCVSQHRVETGH